MGLSSSQARLLTLTSRMHDIEYKAAKLEAQKLQMANESRRVYDDYLVALDKTKIQLKTLNNDGSIDYIDATYNRIMNAGYKLSSAGRIVVSQSDVDYFNNVAHGNALEFACLKSGFAVKDGSYTVLASNHDIGLAFNETGLKQLVNGGKNIALMDDITVNSSLGSYSKTLDGNGKTLTVKGSNGAFTTLNGATVKNLNLSLDIEGSSDIGGLAQISKGTTLIENVYVSGTIKGLGNSIIGGLIADHNNGSLTIQKSTTDVEIDTGECTPPCVGGLVGRSGCNGAFKIDNAMSNLVFTGNNAGNVGGFFGYSWTSSTELKNSKSNVNITCYSAGGGACGTAWANDVRVENCYVSGSITTIKTDGYTGGIIPVPGTSAGQTFSVSNCYSDVTCGPDTHWGDIVGVCNYGSNGTFIVNSCASKDGVAQDEIIYPVPSASTLNFTPASDANAVKDSALAASAGAGATLSNTYTPPTTSAYNNFYEIGLAIQEDRVLKVDGMEDNTEWLTNMINGGEIILQKPDKNGNYYDISVATDTGLQEVSDEKDLRKAEAKYEADMKKIDAKDKKYDTELAAIDNERNAVKAEMETLKTVAKDNVERTFKLFS